MPTATLKDLRLSRGLTQKELGNRLNVDASAVVKIERRTNQNLSTISKFIEALGGDLQLVARFPEGEFALSDLLNDELK